jgi:hypothetical protein
MDFVGIDSKGMMTLSHIVSNLPMSAIAGISQSTEPIATGGVRHLEDVAFVFQKIELVDVKGNSMAMHSLAE